MKTFIKISISFFILFSLTNIFSCSDDSSTKTPETKVEFSAYQIAGCNHSLGKTSNSDSCFDYSFNDTLKIDFCVTGNCCPDSNRFVTNCTINSDTLFVTVADTAANGCHCMCNYTIHVELSSLPKDHYVFYCNYDGLEYTVIVNRYLE